MSKSSTTTFSSKHEKRKMQQYSRGPVNLKTTRWARLGVDRPETFGLTMILFSIFSFAGYLAGHKVATEQLRSIPHFESGKVKMVWESDLPIPDSEKRFPYTVVTKSGDEVPAPSLFNVKTHSNG
jgi:hypothetical protein